MAISSSLIGQLAQLGLDRADLGQQALALEAEVDRLLGLAVGVQPVLRRPDRLLRLGQLALDELETAFRLGRAPGHVLAQIGLGDAAERPLHFRRVPARQPHPRGWRIACHVRPP